MSRKVKLTTTLPVTLSAAN